MLNPRIKVIGVEPAGAACMKASLEAGHVVKLPSVSTIADGTAVLEPGDKVFPYIQENIDEIITVDDDELIVAFLDMVEKPQDGRRELRLAHYCRTQTLEHARQEGRLHSFRPETWT